MNDLGKASQESLAKMIENTSVPFIVSNPRIHDNPIIMCNKAFVELTGYNEQEILGRNCRFLSGKDTNPQHTQLIVNAVRNHEPVLVEILNYKKDGTPFQNALMIAPIFDDDGELAYFLGSQMELTKVNSLTLSKKRKAALHLVNSLSPQQKRVLTKVANGYKNKQIAHALKISESTVKKHRAEIFSKLNVTTTAESIRIAVEAGL